MCVLCGFLRAMKNWGFSFDARCLFFNFIQLTVNPSRTWHIIINAFSYFLFATQLNGCSSSSSFAGKRASIESMSPNLTVKEGKKVKIVCKVDGEPAPKVTWFKDGRSINRNRTKYIFVHLRWVCSEPMTMLSWWLDDFSRRRSDLIIKSAAWNDSGKYECRAKNKQMIERPVSKYTKLEVVAKQNLTTPRTSREAHRHHSNSLI